MKRFDEYLKNLCNEPCNLSETNKEIISRAWGVVKEHVPNLIDPVAGPNGELGFYIEWRKDQSVAIIEICESGEMEFYCYDPGFSENFRCGRVFENLDDFFIRFLSENFTGEE